MARTSKIRLGLSLCVLAILAYCSMEARKERLKAEAYMLEREQLLGDPLVAPLILAGNATCRSPDQTSSYIWACGATLRINGPTQGDFCSTENSPRYTGELVAGGFGVGYSQAWSGYFTEPLSEMRRCEGPQGQIDPACIHMGIYGADTFDAAEGKILAADLIEPDFSRRGTENNGSYVVWTALNGLAVRHNFALPYGEVSLQKQQQSRCNLIAHHPRLPLLVKLDIPCDRRFDWKAILEDAFLGLDRSLVDFDDKALCDAPPEGVRFTINIHGTAVGVLRDWARQKEKTGQP